ncbi:unnamed protein product [Gongylonema pulchrum]|uniref:Mitochondrial import receptor subunit TOM20 homolog n=1 Tax=Gongylonema pulchrum TaxID=637853 RepID=A0A183DX39_9BILA|nr:unnamed protein product [Gongylonema pulchrum]
MSSDSFLSSAFSRQAIVTAAGLAAAAFIGYCVYFDRKRRSAPDYKKKLREQRRAASLKKQPKTLPNPHNPAEVQAYFLQEVQLGEELIGEGHVDRGVEHLCNAIVLCGQPSQLLQIFQQTLPNDHFALLVQKLPEAKMRLMRMFGDQLEQAGSSRSGPETSDGPSTAMIEISDDLDLA